MARLFMHGAEVEVPVDTGSPEGNYNQVLGGGGTRDTSVYRSGVASFKFDGGAGNLAQARGNTFSTGQTGWFYLRAYLRFTDLPTGQSVTVLRWGTGSGFGAKLTTGGKLQLWNEAAGTQIGSDSSATISAGSTWYRIELAVNSNGTNFTATELKLDGTTVASASGLSVGVAMYYYYGWCHSPGANHVCYADDVALNDSTGSANNSWPGEGKLVLMKPYLDYQVGMWTGGAGGAANLYDAVNNTPPIGTASETNLTQIERAALDDGSTEYEGDCGTYTTAGIGASDTINAIQAWVNHGEDVATNTKTGSVGTAINPAQSYTTFTFGADVGALGTYPTNWRWQAAAMQNAPTVALGSSLVIAVRKTDTGSRTGSADFLGAYVDYTIGSLSDAAAQVSWTELQVPSLDAAAQVSWTEVEVPTANAAAQVSWSELEVPTANAAAQVSWAEVEVPAAPAAAQISWTEFEVPSLVDAAAQVSWSEFEVPSLDAAAQVSWSELEVPTASARAEVSWTEVEVPTADAAAQVSWAEFEVPPLADAGAQVSWAEVEVPFADAQGQVSWAELEVPTADSAAQVSWAEVEVPDISASAQVSWTEFEVPFAPAAAQVSWSEFEVPTADAGAQVSWTEFEVPSVGLVDAAAQVSWAEFEVPALVDAAAQVSWAEFEVPSLVDAAAQVSWTEVQIPTADAMGQVSWAEFEVPTADARAEVSWAEMQVPFVDALAQVTWTEMEFPTADSQALISWAELEVPIPNASAQVSWVEMEVPTADSTGQVGWAAFEVPDANANANISWVELEVPTLGEIIQGTGKRNRTSTTYPQHLGGRG